MPEFYLHAALVDRTLRVQILKKIAFLPISYYMSWFPHRLENGRSFSSQEKSRILNILEKSGDFAQNAGIVGEFGKFLFTFFSVSFCDFLFNYIKKENIKNTVKWRKMMEKLEKSKGPSGNPVCGFIRSHLTRGSHVSTGEL